MFHRRSTRYDLEFVEENEPNTHVMNLNDELANQSAPCTECHTELSSSVENVCNDLRGKCGGKLHGDLFGIPGSEVPLVQDHEGSLSVLEVPAVQQYGGSLNPLLNSIGKDNIPSDCWLIDSGASCCCKQTNFGRISVTVS